MTLIKDLIHVPERVRRDDFVLKLTEGVIDPKATLRDYVVTEQLVACFDQALELIRDAVQGPTGRPTSKATYLHGSFGSGKSHFMAVLHLLLQGNADARSIPELAGVVAKHDAWLMGKGFPRGPALNWSILLRKLREVRETLRRCALREASGVSHGQAHLHRAKMSGASRPGTPAGPAELSSCRVGRLSGGRWIG